MDLPSYEELISVTHYYRLFTLTNAALCTILFPIVFLLIFFKSPKEMGCYRWFLLNCSASNYALALLFALWQPMPLFSLLVALSGEHFLLDLVGQRALIILLMGLSMTLALTCIFCFVFQYAALKPFSTLNRHFGTERYRNRLLAYGIGVAIVVSLVTSFVLSISATTEERDTENRHESIRGRGCIAQLTRRHPIPTESNLHKLTRRRHTNKSFSISSTSTSHPDWFKMTPSGIIALSTITLVVVLEGSLVVVLNFGVVHAIRQTKSVVLPSTHQLQRMLHRMFLLKSILFTVCFVLPMVVEFLCILGVVRSPYFTLACNALIDLHTAVLLVKLLHFKPYRDFLLHELLGLRRNSVSSSGVAPSSSNTHASNANGEQGIESDEKGRWLIRATASIHRAKVHPNSAPAKHDATAAGLVGEEGPVL